MDGVLVTDAELAEGPEGWEEWDCPWGDTWVGSDDEEEGEEEEGGHVHDASCGHDHDEGHTEVLTYEG